MLKKVLFYLFPLFTIAQNQSLFENGDYFLSKSQNDSAVFYYNKAFNNCINCEVVFLANYYLKFGEANRLMGNNSIALSNFLKAEKSFIYLNNYDGIVKSKIYLSDFYRSIHQVDKSFALIEAAANMIKKKNIKKEILAYYYNRRAAIIAQKFDDKEQVIKLSKKAIEIAEKLKLYKILIYAYNELAYAYQGLNKKTKALSYYKKAFEIGKSFHLDIETCDVLYNMVRLECELITEKFGFLNEKNFNLFSSILSYNKEGLKIASRNNYLLKQKAFSKELFMFHKDIGKYEEAMKYNELYFNYKSELLKKNKTKEILEIEEKFLSEKKDNQIRMKEAQIKNQYLALASIGVLAFVFLAFFLKSKKNQSNIKAQKEKIEEILHQKTTLLKEIHHRVKNNLQLTSGLLYLQANKHNDPKISEMVENSQKHINSIALVHEMLYQDNAISLIEMHKYLKELGNRLLLFSANKKISYHLEASEISLPIDYATTLGLILNELITNSLKHAFMEVEGTISVELSEINMNLFRFIYKDNGKGLQKKSPEKTLGLKLINMFAEEIDADLEVKSENGLSYTFTFTCQ